MKRLLSLLFVFILVCSSICSCQRQADAYGLISEFVTVYGAEGIIYSPAVPEGEDGYIPDGLVEKIYVFSGRFPENFAIFLNSHPLAPAECGVFVCDGADSLAMTEEMCLERIRLLSGGEDHAFVKLNGMTVFYSTMHDRERAERIWREIIR